MKIAAAVSPLSQRSPPGCGLPLIGLRRAHCDFVSARLVSVAPLPAEDEDVDVARERRRVHEGWAQDDLLRVCDLTKVMT